MSTAAETCPPLEEIAAFLDGRLTGEERARAVAHLAECEACYEIFAGAARFQLDEEQDAAQERESEAVVIPFPRRKLDFRWAAAIAAVLLVGVVTVSVYQKYSLLGIREAAQSFWAATVSIYERFSQPTPPPQLMTASLVSPELLADTQVPQSLWDKGDTRGGGNPAGAEVSSPFELLVGAHLVDLHIALFQNNQEAVLNVLARIIGESDEVLGAKREVMALKHVQTRIDHGKAPKDFEARAEAIEAIEASLTENLADSPYLALGKWLEAGRLSAIAKQPGFFQDDKKQRFLDWRLRHAEDDFLDPEVVGKLEQIRSILDESEAPKLPYERLATLFEGILQHYQDEARA